MLSGNLHSDIPSLLPEELLTTIVARHGVRVERIVSRGHVSPPGFWYDQPEHELVFLLEGSARLEIEGQGELVLEANDYVELAAHVRHRVTFTDPQRQCIWLAIFYKPT